MNIKFIGFFNIVLILLSSISFVYILGESNSFNNYLPVDNRDSKLINFVREKVLGFLSAGLVSAQTSSGMQTCLVNLNGTSCQEYPVSTCDSQCATAGGCFQGRRSEFPQCQLGTCFDNTQGVCNPGTPRFSCENENGVWSPGTPAQCNKHCCLINPDGDGQHGSQARLTTERECALLRETFGSSLFKPTISGQAECSAMATSQEEGACVLGLDALTNKYNCKFETETQCITSGGTFYLGQLCTNPQLNTKCERTGNTKCFKDRVYFVDNCGNGNRANIYDSTKLNDASYWSTVVPIASSCSLGTSSNFLSNQARCGNCNYIAGSTCGTPIQGKDVPAISGQYVCRDLSCIKEDGTKVKHRSSWCAFDGAIGVDGADGTNEERSVDVPGSRHYKKQCFDGEIRNETCAEYRNQICVETVPDAAGVTTASCKVNTALTCLEQNDNPEDLARCEENPDCFLKKVEIEGFRVEVCSPKYPTGREFNGESEDENYEKYSENVCSYATKTCV